jgi:ATP phosphoribosyltransferase regulatory subunit
MDIEAIRRKVDARRAIEDIFIREDFFEISPMIFQDYDDYIRLNDGLSSREVIKIIDASGDVKVLRPDITSVIGESMINMESKESIKKFYYSSSVFRNDEKRGAIEIAQIGGEILYDNDMDTVCSIVDMVVEMNSKYNGDFILEVGNAKFLDELLKSLKCDEKKKILGYLRNKNFDDLRKYSDEKGLNDIMIVLDMVMKNQGGIEAVEKLESLKMGDRFNKYIQELKILFTYLKDKDIDKYVHFDLSMVASLDYYTGIIFSGYYYGQLGEVVSGGKYSIGEYDAIGFTMYMDKIYKSIEGSD